MRSVSGQWPRHMLQLGTRMLQWHCHLGHDVCFNFHHTSRRQSNFSRNKSPPHRCRSRSRWAAAARGWARPAKTRRAATALGQASASRKPGRFVNTGFQRPISRSDPKGSEGRGRPLATQKSPCPALTRSGRKQPASPQSDHSHCRYWRKVFTTASCNRNCCLTEAQHRNFALLIGDPDFFGRGSYSPRRAL